MLNGIFLFGLAYAGCDVVMAVIFLTISLAFHGAVSSGVLASMVDNTPNYSGIILGITSTIGIMAVTISPIVRLTNTKFRSLNSFYSFLGRRTSHISKSNGQCMATYMGD